MKSPIVIDSEETSMSLLEQAELQFEEGNFERSSELFERLLKRGDTALGPRDIASAKFGLACCFDRLGKVTEADSLFFSAERARPKEFPAPPRMALADFESIVADTLESLPQTFGAYLDRVQVVVEDYPRRESSDPFCLGLYLGLPRTERTHEERDDLDRIYVYKRNHEIQFSGERLSEEVRKTVIHEIGHHFGLDEHDMGSYA